MTRRPEWMTARTAIPVAVKREVFKRSNGMCERESCDQVGKEIDHVKAQALGGTNDLENLELLCREHHLEKTAKDIADIAKADRMAARAGQQARRKKRGTGQIKSAGFKTNKKGLWKRKLDGSIVKREK